MHTVKSLVLALLGSVLLLSSSARAKVSNRTALDYVAMEYFSNAWTLISKEGVDESSRQIGLSALRSAFLIFVSRDGFKKASKDKIDAGYLTVVHRFIAKASEQEIDDQIKDLYLREGVVTEVDGKVITQDELTRHYQDFLKMRRMTVEEVDNIRQAAMSSNSTEKNMTEQDATRNR